MELNLDDKLQEENNIPKVPSITRLSERYQYKKSEIIDIPKKSNVEYRENNKFSHLISPQDYQSLFKFRQTVQ